MAARYNHGHIIRGLAKLGADLNIEENEHGYTPLTLALVLGHEWAAIELLKAGTHSLTYSLTHLLNHSLTYLLTYSLTHLLTHLLTPSTRCKSPCCRA